MNAIEEVVNRLISWTKQIEKIIIEEIKKESDLIAQLNRGQLMSGTDAFGNPTPVYAPSNKKRGNMNFKLTGDFQRGIKAKFDNKGIDMESTDFKNAFLNPYKKAVETLGLTEESILELQEVILPRIIKRLKSI